jgi:hypothetical protein
VSVWQADTETAAILPVICLVTALTAGKLMAVRLN